MVYRPIFSINGTIFPSTTLNSCPHQRRLFSFHRPSTQLPYMPKNQNMHTRPQNTTGYGTAPIRQHQTIIRHSIIAPSSDFKAQSSAIPRPSTQSHLANTRSHPTQLTRALKCGGSCAVHHEVSKKDSKNNVVKTGVRSPPHRQSQSPLLRCILPGGGGHIAYHYRSRDIRSSGSG